MIRAAELKDISGIKRLIDKAATKHKLLPRSEDELKEVIGSFFVWVENGEIAGCCSLEIYSPKLAEIRSLVVSENFRNKGVGKILVEACSKRAKEQKVYKVLTITEQDSFFEKMGFSKCLGGQWALFMKP